MKTIDKASTVSWTDTKAESGVTYRYTVRAVNGKSLSSYTATGNLMFLSEPNVKIKNASNGIKVSWNLVEGATGKVVDEINRLVAVAQTEGKRVGVIATDETRAMYRADVVFSIGARDDEDAIAQHLYKILRDFDEQEVEAIYSESFATPRIGQAIMNRLLKAAGHQVLQV